MPTQPSPECWQHNLDALRRIDPACAEQLARLAIPDCAQPTIGRDGTATWRIHRGDGQIEWFGRTSMPTISAENLLATFQPGASNMVLPGIGSGLEVKLLSDRLGRHRSVVVLETDPLNLALALRLWDMSEGLASHRIILLLAADLAGLSERLLHQCQEHPGFDLPTRMLGWPWRTKEQSQSYQDLIQQVASKLHVSRAQLFAGLHSRLQQSAPGKDAAETVAVLTGIPAIATGRQATWLAEGAQAAGMAAVACCPENPLVAGPLAQLAAAAQLAGAERHLRIVLLEQCRNHWPLDKTDVPVISWLVNIEPSGDDWQYPAGRSDLAVVSTDSQQEMLLAKGWPRERVLRGQPFITPKAFEVPLDGPREGIVLIADLPPEDSDKAGITLYSQTVLWDALRDRLDKQGDSWTIDQAQRWFLAAQTATGIDLADPLVQEEFLGHVRAILAPGVILRRTARAILDAGLPLRVAGRGWDNVDWARPFWDGLADDPQHRLEWLARAKVAIVGQCRPGQNWLALEAAASGAVIMARALWSDQQAVQLFEPGKQMLAWRTRQELTERLRSLLRNESARMPLLEQARQRAAQQYAAGVQLRRVMTANRGTG